MKKQRFHRMSVFQEARGMKKRQNVDDDSPDVIIHLVTLLYKDFSCSSDIVSRILEAKTLFFAYFFRYYRYYYPMILFVEKKTGEHQVDDDSPETVAKISHSEKKITAIYCIQFSAANSSCTTLSILTSNSSFATTIATNRIVISRHANLGFPVSRSITRTTLMKVSEI